MSVLILLRFMTQNMKWKNSEEKGVGIQGNVSQCSAMWCAVLWQRCGNVLSIFWQHLLYFFANFSNAHTGAITVPRECTKRERS